MSATARQAAEGQEALVITVEVIEAARPWLEYRYDERQQKLVLERVAAALAERPFDRGIVPHTLEPNGRALEVWILGDRSPMPGALARVRLLGLLEAREPAPAAVLVGALQGDPSLASARALDQLAPARCRDLLRQLGVAAEVEMQGPVAALERLHEARARAARARDEATKGGRAAPAWQASGLRAEGAGEHDASTAAEREVRRLPYRFQQYVAECLRPNERVLLHVTRPAMADPGPGLPLLGRPRLHEGLLVVTDQQVLFLEDAIPPDVTMVRWGYVARAAPPERLAAVAAAGQGRAASLRLDVQAAGGVEEWRLVFPVDRLGWLREAEALLRGFLPMPGSRSLQRRYQVGPGDRPAGEGLDGRAREALAALGRQLREALPAGQRILAEALAPGRPQDRQPDRLVAVTDEAVWVTEASRAARRYGLEEIGTVELRHSLLGSGLRAVLPRDGRLERVEVAFDGPAVADFTRLFVALRQLLARSGYEASPDRDSRDSRWLDQG